MEDIEITEKQKEKIMSLIDENEGKKVHEFARITGYSTRTVQRILEKIMDDSESITSTPDWEYRKARKI